MHVQELLFMHCFENPMQEFPIFYTVFKIQFYLKIYFEFEKVFFMKVVELKES